MAGGLQDPINMVGISDLVDRTHTNTAIKLDELEKSLVGLNALQIIQVKDPDQEFNERMQRFGSAGPADVGAGPQPEEVGEEIPVDDLGDETLVADDIEPASVAPQPPRVPMPGTRPMVSPQSKPQQVMQQPSRYPQPGYVPQPAYPPQYAPQYPPQPGYPPQYAPQPGYPPQYPPQYAPQQPGSQLDDAIRDYGGYGNDVDIALETEEETKNMLLDDMEELRTELDGYGVNYSTVPKVTADSPLKEIKDAHRRLRRKYDFKRCQTFGTELILAGAHGLEYLFDGQKSYGPFKPDLTDWHNNIRPKLRRMQYETSSVVSDVMHDYNIGNIARIGLELGISALLHSKSRQAQRGNAAYTQDQMSDAYESLRDFEA